MTEILHVDNHAIMPVVNRFAAQGNLTFDSLLDIGSSDRPLNGWFCRYGRAIDPRRYLALEIDPVMVARLQAKGLEVATSFQKVSRPSELTLALEVLEHIKPEDSVSFLSQCAGLTGKLFGLTTPNFEYWNRFRAKPEYKECRWIPDHAPGLRPGSANPHDHQQEMTPENLSSYMQQAFPPETWDVQVMRAWPWELKDVARGTVFQLYFKLFAVAIRR